MKTKGILSVLIVSLLMTSAFSQNLTQNDTVSGQKEMQDLNRQHSIGSTIFLLGNLVPGDPPCFFN